MGDTRGGEQSNQLQVRIASHAEVINLAGKIKALLHGGSSPEEEAEIVTAVMELAANALQYAGSGDLNLQIEGDTLIVTCVDNGPGILTWDLRKYEELQLSHNLGWGLGVVHRLMDMVDIETKAGRGTRVVARRRLGIRTGPPPLPDDETRKIGG